MTAPTRRRRGLYVAALVAAAALLAGAGGRTRRRLRSDVEVDCSPGRAWWAVSDMAAYAGWNPFITEAEGSANPGGRLKLRLEPPAGMAMTVRSRVVAARSGAELRWRGWFLAPGVVNLSGAFLIESLGPKRTRVVYEEGVSGLLVPLLSPTLESHARGLEEMLRALKLHAEAVGTQERPIAR